MLNQQNRQHHQEADARILLLEDSAIDADLISRQVRRVGERVTIKRATMRREFEDRLRQEQFDLILSDYSLPDINGLDALRVASQHAPGIPFIFISGVVGEKFATEAVRAGATDYVTKRDLARIPGVAKRALDEAAARRDRQVALDALQESESRFRSMADSAPALIWATDKDGHINFANRRFESDFDVPISEIEARGWAALLHPDDLATFHAAATNAHQRRGTFQIEVRVVNRKHGTRWLRCEAIARYSGPGQFVGYVGCAVDITDIRHATDRLEAEVELRTRELAEKDEALRQSQKMEAIGQLTGGIAHDFNNMLAGIKGGAELIRKRMAQGRPEDVDRYLSTIEGSADRAAALTHRLLAFSRRQSLDLQGSDINALVRSLLDLLHRTLGEKVFVVTDLEEDAWPALTDSNQLESAILNLAINARDALPDGGQVTISTKNETLADSIAESYGVAAGDYLVVRVADNGSGMPAEVIRKAYDPFFTTKPIGQGTGLGLSMIFGFAKQIGGHTRIESTEGIGTTVEIYMPRDQSARRVSASEDKLMSSSQGTGTILVVEDEVLVQMLVVDHLNDLGYRTIEANDAKSALAVIESDQVLDLMVTDVGLPGMNGRELAEKSRELRPDLKILFATGYAEGATSRSGFLAPGMDMVSKPFDLSRFGEKVSEMLNMEFKGSGAPART